MLPNKSQQSVAQGLAAMITHLRYEGFMIRRLHSDRGREFKNGLVQRLCRQRDVYQTFTQGDDPQQNGRVEGYHARLKGKTRTLLQAASASPRDWPYAMRTAQAAMWAKAMQKFGRPTWHPLPFGTNVKVRTRSWERFGNVWSGRVQNAVVLAPSVETCRGHVVRTDGGALMHTTAVFRGAVQPSPQPVVPFFVQCCRPALAAAGPEVPVHFLASSPPLRRIRGKQSVARLSASNGQAGPELHALSQAAAALLACQPVPFRTAAALLVSSPDLWSLARPLPSRLSAGPSSGYLLFGWFKHGGITGVTAITSTLASVVALLNALLAQAHPTGQWTTLALFSSAVAGPHADRRNLQDSCNFLLPLALPATPQHLWVSKPVEGTLQPLTWFDQGGVARPGFRLPLLVGQPACLDPHSPHAIPSPSPRPSPSRTACRLLRALA